MIKRTLVILNHFDYFMFLFIFLFCVLFIIVVKMYIIVVGRKPYISKNGKKHFFLSFPTHLWLKMFI